MLVDVVTLGFEQRRLDRRMAAVQTTAGRQHPPPGKAGHRPQHVGYSLAAARPSELLGQLAVRDQLPSSNAATASITLRWNAVSS